MWHVNCSEVHVQLWCPVCYQGRLPRVAAEGKLGQVQMGFWCCDLQSVEIMNLVELIGLGEGNKTSLGRLKNDVKRSVRKTLSAKTRDVLKDVEPRLTVCLVLCGCHQYHLAFQQVMVCFACPLHSLNHIKFTHSAAQQHICSNGCAMSGCRRW
jgi:hypothetical protein